MTVTIINKATVSPLIIDKLSVTLNIPSAEQASVKQRLERLISDCYAKRVFKGPMYALAGNIYIDETPDIAVLVQCDPKWSASYLRVEFNPAVAKPIDVKPYLDFIIPGGYGLFVEKGKCTRVDVTVDIHSADINQLSMWHPGYTKTSAYYGNGGIETLYIGSTASPKRYCMYDKRTEIKHKNINKFIKDEVPTHDITRIEVRIRNDYFLHELPVMKNPFEKLGVTHHWLVSVKHQWGQIFLECCRSRGAQDALLMIKDHELRRAYRKCLNTGTPEWWNPSGIWKEWPVLIDSILNPPKTYFTLDLFKTAS